MLQSYESLCFEVSHLHSALKMQTDLVKRLKDSYSLLVASKPGKEVGIFSVTPQFCFQLHQ